MRFRRCTICRSSPRRVCCAPRPPSTARASCCCQRPQRLGHRASSCGAVARPRSLLAALRDVIALCGRRRVPRRRPSWWCVEAPLRLDLPPPPARATSIDLRPHAQARRRCCGRFTSCSSPRPVYAELLRPATGRCASRPTRLLLGERGTSRTRWRKRFMNRSQPERRTRLRLDRAAQRLRRRRPVRDARRRFPSSARSFRAPRRSTRCTRRSRRSTAAPARSRRASPSCASSSVRRRPFDALLDQCLRPPARAARAARSDELRRSEIAVRLEEWTGPYPAIDYRVDETDFNAPEDDQLPQHGRPSAASARGPFAEPVTVRLQHASAAPTSTCIGRAAATSRSSRATPRSAPIRR